MLVKSNHNIKIQLNFLHYFNFKLTLLNALMFSDLHGRFLIECFNLKKSSLPNYNKIPNVLLICNYRQIMKLITYTNYREQKKEIY